MPVPAQVVEIAIPVGHKIEFAVGVQKTLVRADVLVVVQLGLVKGGVCHRIIISFIAIPLCAGRWDIHKSRGLE